MSKRVCYSVKIGVRRTPLRRGLLKMSENEHIERGISAFQVELANIRSFFKTEKAVTEWQDWLWRRMPKLSARTEKIPASAMAIGRFCGKLDRSVLYTDLLTLCCKLGWVRRTRTRWKTTYVWVKETS